MYKIKQAVSALIFLLLVACSNAPFLADNGNDQSGVQQKTARFGEWGVDLSAQDQSVRPGDDFYQYANGEWIDNYELPASKTVYGPFSRLSDEAQGDVREIILDLGDGEYPKGTVEQKIGDLYKSYMDTERRNKLAMAPIQERLKKIAEISSLDELMTAFAYADLNGTGAVIGISGSLDRKNPNAKILSAGVGGVNLPDRDYYLVDNPRFEFIRNEYKKHIATMLQFAGYSKKAATASAENILDVETQIASNLLSRVESRDANKTYNAYTYHRIKNEFPGIDWDTFIVESGLSLEAGIEKKWVLPAPQSINPVIDIIKKTDLQIWKDFLTFTLVANNSATLHQDLEDAAFEFSKIMSGQQEMGELWKRGVGFVSAAFGEAIGEVYVKRHFPEQSKEMMGGLVVNLKEALRARLNDLDWMTDATKQKAIAKLDAFNSKIGYPEKFEDYAGLEITDDNLYKNIQTIRIYGRNKAVRELEEPVDRTKWGMTPQTVNAYFNPSFNEIVFPAAILQAPFFDSKADMAVNYGAIGVVIGHEMSHGFDDQGRKYAGDGVLRDWWNEQDAKVFEARAKVLVEQFNEYSPIQGHYVDGEFTLGENIGDLGGVMIAYQAYKMYLNGREDKVIDGLTGDQRFFLAYAQLWRGKMREERQLQLLKSDPHSPGEYRVNGILRNVDAWYDAFNVQPDNKLYLTPEERVRIW